MIDFGLQFLTISNVNNNSIIASLTLFDKQFNEIIPCIYDDIHGANFYDGLRLVKRGSKYGYVNDSGEEVIPCIYDSASFFSKGKATVSKNGCKYTIDVNGVLNRIE